MTYCIENRGFWEVLEPMTENFIKTTVDNVKSRMKNLMKNYLLRR